jgi:hypothetical protein
VDITPIQKRIDFFERYMMKFKKQVVTAKYIYDTLLNYFAIDISITLYDVLDVTDRLKITIDEVDTEKGFFYWNHISRARRRRKNEVALLRHLVHKKTFKI